jgi:phospholipid N-methyltransferase
LKQKRKTGLKFLRNFKDTGAFKETSRNVELEICRRIPTDRDVVVVEYGVGHGNITREILETMSPNSKLYAFEVVEEFCEYVKENIKDDRLIIINDGAENLKKHVKEPIDAVVSSIPFSFFSEEKGKTIIQSAYDLLNDQCCYSQVLLTKFNFKKFQAVFDDCEIINLGGFPTEYVYHCKKVQSPS